MQRRSSLCGTQVKRAQMDPLRRSGAYGTFTMIALTVDTPAARRVAIENSFIAAVYHGRFDVGRREGEGG